MKNDIQGKVKFSKLMYQQFQEEEGFIPNSICIDAMRNAGTGKTLGYLLGLISQAMLNPETKVYIKSDQPNNKLRAYKTLLMTTITDLCNRLGLDWMEVDLVSETITYNPYIYLRQGLKK